MNEKNGQQPIPTDEVRVVTVTPAKPPTEQTPTPPTVQTDDIPPWEEEPQSEQERAEPSCQTGNMPLSASMNDLLSLLMKFTTGKVQSITVYFADNQNGQTDQE